MPTTRKPLTPLQRLTPNPVGLPQDLAVESAAASLDERRPAALTTRLELPVAATTTKRTFRWSAAEDRELIDLLDSFNRTLPAGARRLRMEDLGRLMRRHFVSSDPQTLLRQAYQEANAKIEAN